MNANLRPTSDPGRAWRLLPDSFLVAADGLRLVPAAARRLRSGAAEPPSGHARPRAAGAPPALRRGGARQPEDQAPHQPAGRGATTPARRSRAESATPSSIPTYYLCWKLSPGRHPGPRRRGGPALRGRLLRLSSSSRRSLPTAATPGSGLPAPPPSPSRSLTRNPDQIGFAVQPRRWVVERFFAWIGRNRRLAKKDFNPQFARAFL